MNNAVWDVLEQAQRPQIQTTTSTDENSRLSFGLYDADYMIPIRGFLRWRATDYAHFPTRNEVADTDLNWEHDVYEIKRQFEFIQFDASNAFDNIPTFNEIIEGSE